MAILQVLNEDYVILLSIVRLLFLPIKMDNWDIFYQVIFFYFLHTFSYYASV